MMLNSKWQKATNKNELLILILKSEKEFAALKNHWNDLYKRTLQVGTSFQQAFKQWRLTTREGQHELFIITIWDGTIVTGVAPLYRNYFNLTSSVVPSRRNLSSPHKGLRALLTKTEKYSICDFSPIMVDNSYLNIFAKRFMDVIVPTYLDTNLLELKYSDYYANGYLYPLLQKRFPTVD